MMDEWAVLLHDCAGKRHVVRVNADCQPSAISDAEKQFDHPVSVRRCRRVFGDGEPRWK
jgi:hypothetical protein